MNQWRARKERKGVVVSNRMEKTVVVSVERIIMEPKYKKHLKRRTKVKAHDEDNKCQVGDRVLLVECRPLSRDKRWRVSQILEQTVAGEKEEPSTADSNRAL